MNMINKANIRKKIISIKATDCIKGKEQELKFKNNSACHFFEKFEIGEEIIQLRLDWTDMRNDHPTLDADFSNKLTKKISTIRGEHKRAHHTSAMVAKENRVYEWTFRHESYCFQIMISWDEKAQGTVKVTGAAAGTVNN